MMVKHISIEVTSKQTKKPVFGGPADLTAYILEPVDGARRYFFTRRTSLDG